MTLRYISGILGCIGIHGIKLIEVLGDGNVDFLTKLYHLFYMRREEKWCVKELWGKMRLISSFFIVFNGRAKLPKVTMFCNLTRQRIFRITNRLKLAKPVDCYYRCWNPRQTVSTHTITCTWNDQQQLTSILIGQNLSLIFHPNRLHFGYICLIFIFFPSIHSMSMDSPSNTRYE